MNARRTHVWLGTFFMAVLAGYSGPANGQSAAGPAVFDEPNAYGEPAIAEDTPSEPVDILSSDAPLPQGQQVNVGSYGQIDLHVKDLDLTKVLQLLSIQSEKNIIASRNVAGTVSADLYGVDFYDALGAILHPNGFGYEEQGQFIYVYTQNELEEKRERERETVFRVVRLSYISGADAATFITPLLSSAGSVAISADAEDGFQPTISDGGANSFAHTDTLLINDYAENVDRIVGVLKQIDVRPKQVLIESTILQTSLTEANAFGVDFAVFADLNLLDFTTPLGAFDALRSNAGPWDSGSATVSTPGLTDGEGTLKFGVLSDDVAVFVRALDRVSDTNVIARPSMLVLNRQKAELLVGERLGYISTNATETSQTQTVEFLDIGTQMTVRPFIGEDDFVRLELRPSVSDGSTSLIGGFVIPDTSTAELVTNVMVKSGQTAVLGGLFKEDTGVSRRQVPGVGDLPLVGPAFSGQDDDVSRSEVIFLIKPTIMKDEYLYQAGEAAEDGVQLSRIGIREGLLPWSRTRLVNWQMRQAYDAYEAGDTDKAKWHSDLALYLDPTVVDARAMNEQITGEQEYLHNFGLLYKVIDEAISRQVDDATMSELDLDLGEAEQDAGRSDSVDQAETWQPESTEAAEAETWEPDASQSTEADTWETETSPSAEAQSDTQFESDTAVIEAAVDTPFLGDEADTTAQAPAPQSEEDEFFSESEDEWATAEDEPAEDETVSVFDVVEAWTPGNTTEEQSDSQTAEADEGSDSQAAEADEDTDSQTAEADEPSESEGQVSEVETKP